MRKRNLSILAGAAMAATPLVVGAATVTYQFDLNDLRVSSTGTAGSFVTAASAGFLSGTTANPVLNLPTSEFFLVGVDVKVAAGTADPSDGGGNLGVAQYQVGLTNSASTIAGLIPIGSTAGFALTTPAVNTDFTANKAKGVSDGSGGIPAAQGISGTFNANGTFANNDTYGGGAFAEVFNNLRGHTQTSNGTTVFSLTNLNSGFQYAVLATAAGSSPAATPATYSSHNFGTTGAVNGPDVIATLPTLTINVGSTGVSNTTGSNKIISLVTGTNPGAPTGTPPNGYGNTSLGTLDVHNGSPAIITESGVGVTSGFVAITTGGAHPTEVGIQVDVNGVHATATQIAQIIADINASNNQGNGSLATTTAAAGLSSVFGTSVDIVMPIGSSTNPFFAFDFSGSQSDFTDGDTALGPVTVTAIAAVPEPATAAGVILGAAGLLLGRRKNRAIAA